MKNQNTQSRKAERPPDFYRVRQVCEITNLSKAKVFAAIRNGALKALRLDGCVLIPRAALTAYLDRAPARSNCRLAS